jgi:predicted ATP-grasp superfamily ATP-dependent carboligase
MGPDLATAIQEICGGRLSLSSYVKSLRGSIECAMFAWDDPMPGLLGLPLSALVAGKRLLQHRMV